MILRRVAVMTAIASLAVLGARGGSEKKSDGIVKPAGPTRLLRRWHLPSSPDLCHDGPEGDQHYGQADDDHPHG